MVRVLEKCLSCILLQVFYTYMYLQIFLIIPGNQSNDILQHSQNRPTGDGWMKQYDNPDSKGKFDKGKVLGKLTETLSKKRRSTGKFPFKWN